MLYNPPTGSTDPNAAFIGKNVAAGIQGSRIPPKAVEAPQREFVNLIVEAGISPTNSDFAQGLRAVRSGKFTTFDDQGSQNHLWIQPITTHTQLVRHLPFRIWPAYTNSGAAYLKVNTLAEVPILRRDGSAIQPGDIVRGVPFDVIADGNGYFRLVNLAQSEVPRIVPAPTLYVRPDGADTNDGSANDAAHAFQTIDAAVRQGRALYYLLGSVLTIQLGTPASYAPPSQILPGAGTVVVRGDPAAPGSYTLTSTGPATTGGAIAPVIGATVNYVGCRLYNAGTGNHSLLATNNAVVRCDYTVFSSIAGNPNAHIIASEGGSITIGTGCSCDGNMGYLFYALGGSISLGGTSFTLNGTPSFATATVAASSSGGKVTLATGSSFSGSASGLRYTVNLNATINTFGAGSNFIPGSSAGTTYTGGQYA
jgi:hypothetical protein